MQWKVSDVVIALTVPALLWASGANAACDPGTGWGCGGGGGAIANPEINGPAGIAALALVAAVVALLRSRSKG